MNFRNTLTPSDIDPFREILLSTGFFYDFEIDIALETAQENLEKGESRSGYIFLVAVDNDAPVGFACYGQAPCTIDSFDLYWIAVHENHKGKGVGQQMMRLVETDVAQRQGKKIWIETSSRPLYEPTRQFYLKWGCELVATLPDFYADNDSKLVFLRRNF